MIFYIIVSLLGVAAGMIGIWKDFANNHLSIWHSWFVLIGLSLCLLVSTGYGCYQYYQTLKKEKYTKTWGNFNFPTDIKRKPDLFFGRYQIASVTISTDKWETWLENGKVKLRGTVRDREGNIIFQINDTDWKNWTGKDFNYDDRGMEVKDSKGNIILQLEFDKKENRVNVFGIFYYGPEHLVLVGRDENRFMIGKSSSSDAEISLFINSMRPIFKYPRENHLGERIKY